MRVDLRERLASGELLIVDGATGTQLQARGLPPGQPGEAWLTVQPDAVADVSRCYAAAGSNLVYTNSFGGNPWRLEHYGLADRFEELSTLAAQLARQGVGDEVYVLGSMGPTGDFLAPLGLVEPEAVSDAYGKQALALLAGGADGLVLETFGAVEEVVAAAQGIRAVTDAPLLVSLTYGAGNRTMMGATPQQAAAALAELRIDVLGLNCGDLLDVVAPVLEAYREAGFAGSLLAKPNAGLPVIENGQPVWPVCPDDFAELAKGWIAAGAQLLGGCCGTSPAYITALSKLV